MKKIIYYFFFCGIYLFCQEKGTGLLLDEKYYNKAPLAPVLMRGDYDNLPASASLKQFTPTPGDQNGYSTCAGWAVSFNARTILEAIKLKWTKDKIDQNTFSPYFIYNQAKITNDCFGGSNLESALSILKSVGDLKLKDYKSNCDKEVNEEDKLKADNFKIIEYRFLAYKDTVNIIKFIRKSLAEGKPVVIGFECPNSFFHVSGELWTPGQNEYKSWRERGHALTVISYDDNKFGGAFEIINSWGTNWGDGGFAWVKYSDFKFFYVLAYEVIDKRNIDTNIVDLSGSLNFKESTGFEMKIKNNGSYFEMTDSYPSGTLFELRITNNEPAYVYAISTDESNKIKKLFPNAERILPYLAYRQNNIALPDEANWNLLEGSSKKSYYCFIYSKENLIIDDIIKELEKAVGTFPERIRSVLGENIVETNNINFQVKDGISFQAKSKGKSVIPIVVQINQQ